MDEECVALLPQVCAVLADPRKSVTLPDDTTLEKLLDWLTELISTGKGKSQLEKYPCLLEFLSTVLEQESPDPSVLSFALKLTGLLAASEEGFRILQERSFLGLAYNCQRWLEAGVWEDPCMRIGWIQGLRSMMQHKMALYFLVHTEIIKPLLQLQTDPSLFVASAANQLLAHLLVFFQPITSQRDNGVGKEEEGKKALVQTPVVMDASTEQLAIYMRTGPEHASVTMAVLQHLEMSLVFRNGDDLPKTLQSLRMLVLLLAQARPPLWDTLLKKVPGSLEALVTAECSQLTQPLMDVLLTAYKHPNSDGAPDETVSRLLSAMLDTHNPSDLIHAAAAVLRRNHRDSIHTPKAVGILLLPLDVITSLTPLSPRATASSIGSTKVCSHLAGCGKVQRCGLEALVALSTCPGAEEKMGEVFTVLIQTLQSPESDPTVLQKCYQAMLQWIRLCKDPSPLGDQLRSDLLSVIRKRVCDLRWEVRDSTLEFLGQLPGLCVDVRAASSLSVCLCEVVLGRSTTALLVEALSDPESYVRASAISALAQTLTHSWQEGAPFTQEQTAVVSSLLDILSKDTEGFARRAVVCFFLTWRSWSSSEDPPSSSSPSSSLLATSLPSVLSKGSVDLDWEVKVHTLELAQLQLEELLPGCRSSEQGLTANTPLPHTRLAAHTNPVAASPACADVPTETPPGGQLRVSDPAGGLRELVEQGVVSTLLSGLFDCDRPVALKACRLLMTLRDALRPRPPGGGIMETDALAEVSKVTCELPAWGWGMEVLKKYRAKRADRTRGPMDRMEGSDGSDGERLRSKSACEEEESVCEGDGNVRVSVCEVLWALDLQGRQSVLTQSSDHVHNSPLSLLQDILTSTHSHSHSDSDEEVIIDCY
ncbi:integrator complex assembly factor BRAT1 [Aplochiton taeniatus]